jgi:fatty acid desaturase
MALLVPGILVLVLFDNLWIQLLNALYLAFAFTQIVFIGHDCGHRQIFRQPSWNDALALCCMPTVGVSYSWWCNVHNRHHSEPNQIGADPAIEYDVFAFSQNQAVRKHGLGRFLVRFQAFYFIPLTLLYPILMRLNSIRYMMRNKPRYPVVEALLFLVHFPLYFCLVFSHLSLGMGVLFVAVHQSLFSLFLVSTFAPNHMGMEILDEDHGLDFLHQQILTAQNVQSHPFADFWFGGLNYQIEHHLFPKIPRNKLKEAQQIIRPFCKKHSISYQETSMLLADLEVHASGWKLTHNPKIRTATSWLKEGGEPGPLESLKLGYEGSEKGSQGAADHARAATAAGGERQAKAAGRVLSLDRHMLQEIVRKKL